ncbi:type II secretion system F family protein [Tumebacillus permanentifrigoris]|uniref:Competence protein ComGB/general secretion pathway protein F n=1 Tax=Tumebacillus permanentifrigoris TaxID=378543 RepID=A0A316D554_9BACL|nr:type II secretion system F family protein [Tumebacillus permanentifrigoris]PWK06283.1 competence protein ComGB/general secretion pathway protein F [Tumebacillus permanentifrigoris]
MTDRHETTAWNKQAARLLRKKVDILRRQAIFLAPSRFQLSEAAWGRYAERLGRLLETGVPLLESLRFLAARGEQRQRALSLRLDRDLRAGRKLSESMRVAQAPLLILALVQAGEHNGDLAANLGRAAASCAERELWRKERRQAMAYPALLSVLLVCLTGFLFEFVIPRFADLYASMGVQIGPGPLLMFALARHDVWLLGLLALLTSVFLLAVRAARERLPLLRTYHRIDRTHQWAVTLGVLLEGGVPLLQALEIQAGLAMPRAQVEVSQRVRAGILRGQTLSNTLSRERLDDALVLSVQVAEATGDLGRALLTSAKELAQRRKRRMDMLLKLVEPLLLLIVGGFVGLVALFLFWPMLDLLQSI